MCHSERHNFSAWAAAAWKVLVRLVGTLCRAPDVELAKDQSPTFCSLSGEQVVSAGAEYSYWRTLVVQKAFLP